MSNNIVNMGVDTAHGKDFFHKLPFGMPFWVFLHMLSPHLINAGETLYLAQPGTCIIYRPGEARYLYTPERADGFRNNWLHFLGDDIETKLTQYKIPISTFFMLKQVSPIITTLQELNYEFSQVSAFRQEMQTALIDVLLLQIARNIIYEEDFGKNKTQHYQAFELLRKRLYLYPGEQWTTLLMANSVFLGQNQFIALYKKFFDITPRQDIINARLQRAKSLLDVTVTLREVGLACGFQNEYYFANVFKKNVGVTPGYYRDKKIAQGGTPIGDVLDL